MKRGFFSFLLLAQIAGIACKRHIIWLMLASFLLLIFLFLISKNARLFLASILFFCLFYVYTPTMPKDAQQINQIVNAEFKIIEKGSNYYLVKNKKARFIIYVPDDFEVGDRLYIQGKIAVIKAYAIPNISSFSQYLEYKQVYYQIKVDQVVQRPFFNLRSFVKKSAYKRLSSTSRDFIQLLVFNDKLAKLDFYEDVKALSVVQLFVISGFHIHILYGFLQKISRKIPCVSFFILLFYLYLINFSVSALRAFFMLLFGTIFKKYKISSFQVLLMTIIVLLCLNPLYLFMLSFQLSIVASFSLLVNKPNKNIVLRPFFTSLFVYLFIFPLLINLNHEISIFSFIYNALLMLPVSLMYMGAWLTVVFKIFDVFYMGLVIAFEGLVHFLRSFNPTLIIGHLSIYLIAFYYFSLLSYTYFKKITLKKQANLSLVALAMLLFYFYEGQALYSPSLLTFLDVGQGDATIIKGKNNEFCVLIDTGGNFYTDMSQQRTIPYLKSLGIRHIDLVIITHDDYDHMGALDSLLVNFDVRKVQTEYFNTYEYKQLKISNLNHYFDVTKDGNYNSLVLYIEYLGQTYLVMGDAPVEIEYQIMENMQIKPLDVLRIGHHGSHTSTSREFLQHTQPKQVIISVGFNNSYGHPHKDVIYTLNEENIPYFRTDLDGSIVVKKKNSFKNLLDLLYNIIVARR